MPTVSSLALSLPDDLSPGVLALLTLGCVLGLGWRAAPRLHWLLAGALLLALADAAPAVFLVYGVVALVFGLTPLRRAAVTRPVLAAVKGLGLLPVISETERAALEAGTVWVDGELFSGRPDGVRLLDEDYPDLTDEERAFLDGPVAEVCAMTDDWEVHKARDLPPQVWEALKRHGFFGLIIGTEYGGRGFSASANSAIVARLSSRSLPLAISVMVPNSLGPAELLSHYGTQEQKDHYLPRLARGEDMPAFALTEPGAGSDAGSISSSGVVFRADDGRLMLRLDWDKRYITLAAISTVLGLAFKLRDPEQLLGRGVELGITCALIPTDTPGVILGRRHDPMGIAFYNCPTKGEGVVVPLDAVIGGEGGVGRGWTMLMECLAAGRGISLPANASAMVQTAARVAGAYAAVRRQFGMPIGRFEGVEEPLARIGGHAWLLEAARRYTNGGLDAGNKPAVVTAMVKYAFTELGRDTINDAMDVVAGAGISGGPRNLLGRAYQGTPISITVEGANILTRCLMIFGQGAIRCHPFAYAEVRAAAENDLVGFDRAFWGHIGHVVGNGSRALLLSLTRGRLAASPVDGVAAPYWRRLQWASASFAFLADTAMAGLGGALKRRETVSGRFSDIMCWMYLATAALRRFEADGRRPEDVAFLEWSMETAFARMQAGFDGIYRNLDLPLLGLVLAGPVALWSRLNTLGSGPDDALGVRVARALQVPGEQRDRLTPVVYLPRGADEALARLERAFTLCVDADAVAGRIREAIKQGRLPRGKPLQLVDEAVGAGVISAAEAEAVAAAEAARDDVIQVDSFPLQEYLTLLAPTVAPPVSAAG